MDEDGLICAFDIDANGKARELSYDQLEQAPVSQFMWVHVDLGSDGLADWLNKRFGLGPVIIESLCAYGTRPRVTVHDDALVLILRGVNLNPGEDPEDMISLRFYIDNHRVISLQGKRLFAMEDLRQQYRGHVGPRNKGDFLIRVIQNLLDRIWTTLEDLEGETDHYEEQALMHHRHNMELDLNKLRRRIILMRRFIAPERDALSSLISLPTPWMDSKQQRAYLREAYDRTSRYVEDLDSLKERTSILFDMMQSWSNEKMNRAMYTISIFTVIFLPLHFITGLLGINVGGVPGANNNNAFYYVLFGLLLVAFAEAAFFLRRRLFRKGRLYKSFKRTFKGGVTK